MSNAMKMTTAFRILTANRAAKTATTKNFMVKKLNKDGSVSKAMATEIDWRFNAFVTEAEAVARVTELEKLNPGARFVVVTLRAPWLPRAEIASCRVAP